MLNFAPRKFINMNKLKFILLAIAVLTISSCSNKVDLYSDKGDSTIVYMMLDSGADTNFAKITKSFIGNANVLAYDYNANNYVNGELKKVYLLREKAPKDTVFMDTVSKWIPYNPYAQFYSGCYQKYYYTKRKLNKGSKYNLFIERKDGVTVSSTTETISGYEIITPTEDDEQIDYDAVSNRHVEWISEDSHSNAAYFEVVAYFRYKEVMPGSTDTVSRSVKWTLGKGTAEKLYNSSDHLYNVNYKPNTIYNVLENDEYLKNNSPYGVKRYIRKTIIEISAVGNEFYNYLLINNSSSAIQDTPEYTNVINGYGLVSSRSTTKRLLIPGSKSKQTITNTFPEYGFVYDPNDPTD